MDTLLPMMFLGLLKLGNIFCGHKMFVGKYLCRQQCVRNNENEGPLLASLVKLQESTKLRRTVASDTSLCSTVLVFFSLELHPVDRAHMKRPLRQRNTRYKNPQLVTQHCFVASFGRCLAFFTLLDQLDPQQKHLLRDEEMRRADWLICRARANLLRDKLRV